MDEVKGAALWRLEDRGLLELRGPDRIRLLHGATTNDVLLLATGREGGSFKKGERIALATTPAGRGQFSTATNRQGKMVAAFSLLLEADRVLLDVDRAALPALKAHLESLTIMDDVQYRDATDGASWWRVEDSGLARDLAPFHFRREGNLSIQRHDPGVVIRADGPSDIESRLLAAGAVLRPADDLERRRIAAGWPRWGVDIGPDLLPVEAGLEGVALSYTKGCYLGQEVLQRVKTYSEPPLGLVRVELGGGGGPEIGRLTSRAGELGLALVKKGHRAPGTTGTLEGGIPARVL